MLVHHRINIWSSSTTERKTVSRGSSQGKIELTANAFVFKNLKMEVDTEKNLVKGSAEQTGNELTRGLMKHKFNERYCTRSNNETESSHWLADDYYRKGKNDESSTNQTQVKESKSSRKCSKLCYDETVLVERDSDAMLKSFSHEFQHDHGAVRCDPHLRSEGIGNCVTLLCDNAFRCTATCSKKSPATNMVHKKHPPLSRVVAKHFSSTQIDRADRFLVSRPPPKIVSRTSSRRKLLILDVNGVLADVVSPPPKDCRGDINILRRAIFKRPFYQEFLRFCFDNFDVGIWSSRSKKVVDRVIDYLLGDMKHNLVFSWDLSKCTKTGLYTLENKHKPLVCKDLRKIWEGYDDDLPWEKGVYNESNTLLLDDSPHKALLNPMHTAVFPYSFTYKDKHDTSLGPGGDLRVYVEKLATTGNMRKYVEKHPFGQSHIDETNSYWDFYSKVLYMQSNVSTTSYLGTRMGNSVPLIR
ncbi:hypothetical protein ACET3Z_026636 [Daucus carota]